MVLWQSTEKGDQDTVAASRTFTKKRATYIQGDGCVVKNEELGAKLAGKGLDSRLLVCLRPCTPELQTSALKLGKSQEGEPSSPESGQSHKNGNPVNLKQSRPRQAALHGTRKRRNRTGLAQPLTIPLPLLQTIRSSLYLQT